MIDYTDPWARGEVMTPPDTSAELAVRVEEHEHGYELRAGGRTVCTLRRWRQDDQYLVVARWVVPPEQLPNQLVLNVCTVAGMLLLEHRRRIT